jgi:hypothetical protein
MNRESGGALAAQNIKASQAQMTRSKGKFKKQQAIENRARAST